MSEVNILKPHDESEGDSDIGETSPKPKGKKKQQKEKLKEKKQNKSKYTWWKRNSYSNFFPFSLPFKVHVI